LLVSGALQGYQACGPYSADDGETLVVFCLPFPNGFQSAWVLVPKNKPTPGGPPAPNKTVQIKLTTQTHTDLVIQHQGANLKKFTNQNLIPSGSGLVPQDVGQYGEAGFAASDNGTIKTWTLQFRLSTCHAFARMRIQARNASGALSSPLIVILARAHDDVDLHCPAPTSRTTVTDISPPGGVPKTVLTFTGSHFQNVMTVQFAPSWGAGNSATSPAHTVSSTSATAQIPALPPGVYLATIGEPVWGFSHPMSVAVTGPVAPFLSSIATATGKPGDSITFGGSNFAPGMVVFFTPKTGEETSFLPQTQTATSMSLTIPSILPQAYKVSVGYAKPVPNGRSNSLSFTVR
jgi:hypothetical protein